MMDWRSSEVLQRHVDTITKVLRGMGSALSHSGALPVQVTGERWRGQRWASVRHVLGDGCRW